MEVRDLRVELVRDGSDVVDGVSFDLRAGEVLALVGESGSGKTTVGTALLGHVRKGACVAAGTVTIDETDLLRLDDGALRRRRGVEVAYVPQDPGTALNPALRLEVQLRELLDVHEPGLSAQAARERMLDALEEVKLPRDPQLLRRFPHQISGGQQQRVCLALAFLLRPRVIVLDEPTTGLDVTTQAHVLATVRELCKTHRVAALYVTHDLTVAADLADRIMVMYAGRIAEIGPRDELFGHPTHPYTSLLMAAVPDVAARRGLEPIPGSAPPPGERPAGCEFAPRCPARLAICDTAPPVQQLGPGWSSRCHRAQERLAPVAPPPVAPPAQPSIASPVLRIADVEVSYGPTKVLHGVSLELAPEECLALVGESGSGKTTLSRAVVGLLDAWSGTIELDGEPLAVDARRRSDAARRELQYIFQNPYTSLNPRQSVRELISLPLRHFFQLGRREAHERVQAVLEEVSLSQRAAGLRPADLSGGERQRVAIARALVCEPRVLVCDEITSALDVSVQAVVVELLRSLQRERQLSLLFVTHNLALVRSIADRVAVLDHGRLVELGSVDRVLDRPEAEYTKQLMADTPSVYSPSVIA
jgi:peptide/nickel transport system ATP-binding protein